jgi:probable rRNA maturation factor
VTAAHLPGANVTVSDESGGACDTDALFRLSCFLLERLRLHPDCELGITLVGLDRMTALHVEWMAEPGATDVLSFPIDELRSAPEQEDPAAGVLGAIALCPDFAVEQAAAAGRTLDQEMQFLVTHGVLHLIGYDHMTDQDHAEMFGRQDDLLAAWWSG